MATVKDLEDVLSRRANAQGVVTRHINSLKRALDGGAARNSSEVTSIAEKLLDAKSRYDELQSKAVELSSALDVDRDDVLGPAEKVDTEVTTIMAAVNNVPNEGVGASDTSDKGNHREETLKKIKELQKSLNSQPTFQSPTKEDLKQKIREIDNRHQEEAQGMRTMIEQLKSELHELKLQANGHQGLISTPAGSTRQRVRFNNMSTIHASSGDTDMRAARRSQMFDNTPVRGYDGLQRYQMGPYRQQQDYRDRYSFGERDSVSIQQKMLDLSERQHKSFLASLNAPAVKLTTFTGEPLDYVSFFNNFNELVDEVEDNPRVKLSKLQAHCSDRAARAIAGCGSFPAEEGYRKARKILKQKFGNEYVITQAWLQKLLSYGQLKAADEIESFALDLASCKDSLYSLGYHTELRSSHTLSLIVAKLPFFMRNKWRRIHREHINGGSEDVVCKLVEMVQEAADDVCDPVFSETAISKIRNTYEGSANPGFKGRNKRRAAVNMVGNDWNERLSDCETPTEVPEEIFFAGRDRAVCAGCSSSQHFTSKCRRFKELNPKERLTFVTDKGLCVICLSSDHTTEGCKLPWRCQDKTCGGKHHTALHGAFAKPVVEHVVHNIASIEPEDVVEEMTSSGMAGVYLTGGRACLPIVPVLVRNGPHMAMAYALLDTGSTLTMFHINLKKKLNLAGMSKERYDINTMTSTKRMEGIICNFEIAKPNREEFFPVFEGIAVENLPITTDHLARATKVARWEHLHGMCLPEVNIDAVEILIGQDNAHLLEPLGKIKGKKYEPYAVKTPLGWTIFGSLDKPLNWGGLAYNFHTSNGKRQGEVYNVTLRSEVMNTAVSRAMTQKCAAVVRDESSLQGSLERFWKLDTVPERKLKTREDQKVLDLWNREYKIKDRHVVLPIPYKQDPPYPPNNYAMALSALNTLGRRLNRSPVEKVQYVTSMKKNFDNKHAIVVPTRELANKKYTLYLLHHGVDHPRKPGVTRVVKHGSAKFRGVSLNDLTYVGPDLMNKLQAVLIRFRQYKSTATGDVENMFNMVWCKYEHQDSMRFLWWKDHEVGGEVIVCRMTTHIFGTGWAPAAAMFALRKLAEVYEDMFPPRVIRSILDDFYVDDWLDSEPSDDDVINTREGVTELLSNGSFNLCKFASNSRQVLSKIDVSRRAKELATIDLASCDQLPQECTLGAGWSPQKDAFFYGVKADPKPMTRRGLTSSVASIYDPMGLVTPFVVPAKLLMQTTCRNGARWDDLLDEAVAAQWGRWLRDLDRLDGIDIPRWLGCTESSVNTLHHIGDASVRAYGGASYLVVKDKGKAKSSLVLSKSRLAPVKTQSIPRLEMCAAVVATKLDTILREYLSVPLEESHFWSDSTIVLYMLLLDPGRLKTFMGNRVACIQEATLVKQWHHIPTDQNPADLLSRGAKLEELVGNKLWFEGPDFLVKDPSEWPAQPGPKLQEHQASVEVKKDKPVYYMDWDVIKPELESSLPEASHVVLAVEAELSVAPHLVAAVELTKDPKNESLIKFTERFESKWESIRAVAWLKRYIQWKKTGVKPSLRLTLAELRRAELEYVKLNQRLYLTRAQVLTPGFRKLFPIDDDGAWRVGGRLDQASMCWNKKHPFVVPENSPLARQVIREAHKQTAHAGPDRVIAECRNKYWVLNGMRYAKQLRDGCVTCVRLRGRPMEQVMAPLHEDRLKSGHPPFTSTGVDLFGPLMVTVRRAKAKRYGVVYSCLTSRAVHFELAEDLSVSGFLDSMERFVARRGLPSRMHSDNGTNFVKGRKEIEEARATLESDSLHNEMCKKDVEWKMNAPSASHQGGSWERMIRTAREIIVALIEGWNVTESQLSTVLCRAENIMNSRPLTRLCLDETSIEPLTPNHLLTMRAPKPIFPLEFDASKYRDAWKNVQSHAAGFWRRWMMFYIPELQKRNKWIKTRENLRAGELVIVVQDQYPRFEWPLAVVEEVYPGRDGKVRNAAVRTHKGTYRRLIQKLLRLELDTG